MKWALYNVLFALVYPFLLPGFILRMIRRGGYAARMGDRFALYPDGLFGKNRPLFDSHSSSLVPHPSSLIWIHAVSVGEVQVAGQLMREWRKADPSVRFCFSTTSSTGWMMALKEVKGGGREEGQRSKVKGQTMDDQFHCLTSDLGPWTSSQDVLIYNPLDFPNFVKSALRTVRPRAIVLTESEIWPNFIRQAKRMGIPLFLINARVSDRSAPRYRFARFFFKDVLSSFTRIFAQSDLDKARLVAAGAPADIVDVTGSFKFDVAHRNEAKERELREWIFGEKVEKRGEGGQRTDSPLLPKILLGGSTWPGEDEVLLRIYRSILNLNLEPQPLLVLAPRHFEKADAVETNIRKAGFICVRRSKVEGQRSKVKGQTEDGKYHCLTSDLGPRTSPAVYLADTTGELMGLYGIADVVFVGKSLCAHGSQNMIEPCLCGRPTVVGPYTENFRPVMSDLLSAEAIVQVKDESGLSERIRALLVSDNGLGARAAAAVKRRCGVVARCVESIRGMTASRVVAAVLTAVLFASGCSREEEVSLPDLPAFLPAEITSAYIALVENPDAARVFLLGEPAKRLAPYFEHAGVKPSFALDGKFDVIVVSCGEMSVESCAKVTAHLSENGVMAWMMDMRETTVASFRARIRSFAFEDIHLWMSGEMQWMLVGRRTSRRLKLSAMLDLFAREQAFEDLARGRCGTLPEVFANYVGARNDIIPAFAFLDLKSSVRPENFITREVPALDWISSEEMDEDIAKGVLADMRSMQVVRRLVLEGNGLATSAVDKKGEEAATDVWARAALRNPNDLFLLERINRLERNAAGFLEVGKLLQAMKCYETIVLIRPNDPAAVHNFGMCLKKIGKVDLAEKALARARKLEEAIK